MAIALEAQRLTVLVKTRQGDDQLKDREAKAELAHSNRKQRPLDRTTREASLRGGDDGLEDHAWGP